MIVRALGVLVALACFSAPVVRAVMRSDAAAFVALLLLLAVAVGFAHIELGDGEQ